MSNLRERLRSEMTAEIKQAARDRLAVEGPDLSLRAVARDVGMVSSAIYRYFPSRDDLLTALIVDGYTALADRVEAAESAVPRTDLAGRFAAVAHAVRDWAKAHPAEYALLYGTPVPGYVAPQETVVPVARMGVVLIDILRDGFSAGELVVSPDDRMPQRLREDLADMLAGVDRSGVPAELLSRGLLAWSSVFGLISFELFGHLVGAVSDHDLNFEYQIRALNREVGLV
jgi:AcrR family transcriptional regulator